MEAICIASGCNHAWSSASSSPARPCGARPASSKPAARTFLELSGQGRCRAKMLGRSLHAQQAYMILMPLNPAGSFKQKSV